MNSFLSRKLISTVSYSVSKEPKSIEVISAQYFASAKSQIVFSMASSIALLPSSLRFRFRIVACSSKIVSQPSKFFDINNPFLGGKVCKKLMNQGLLLS